MVDYDTDIVLAHAVENTQENRRAYRTLLLTAPGA